MLLIDHSPTALKLVDDITEVIDQLEEYNFCLEILEFEPLFWNDADEDYTADEMEALRQEFYATYAQQGDVETVTVEDLLLNYLAELEDTLQRYVDAEEIAIAKAQGKR